MSGVLSFCLVSTFYPPWSFGGDGVHVQRFARGLVKRGHRVRVIHSPAAYELMGGRVDPDDPGEAQSSTDGNTAPRRSADPELVALPRGVAAAAGVTATYLTGRAVGYAGEMDAALGGFDVLHFHNPSLLGGIGALSAGAGPCLRLYSTTEHWLLCPTHTLFRFNREICERPTCWRCSLVYRRPPQLWRHVTVPSRQIEQLDALICPSRFTQSLHQKAFPQTNIQVLHSLGADSGDGANSHSRATASRVGERPFFLFSGRLEPIKGIAGLIASFSAVKGADLVVAGDGSQGQVLRHQAIDNPAIRFTGRLSHSRLFPLVSNALAVIVPSIGYETFGLSALEAMALGTPVVVSGVGALPELVEDGGGMVFDGTDELAGKLQSLVDDPTKAKVLGRQAASVASARFGESAFFRRYFELLAELADRRNLDKIASIAKQAQGLER